MLLSRLCSDHLVGLERLVVSNPHLASPRYVSAPALLGLRETALEKQVAAALKALALFLAIPAPMASSKESDKGQSSSTARCVGSFAASGDPAMRRKLTAKRSVQG
jgi:hypothetical protein